MRATINAGTDAVLGLADQFEAFRARAAACDKCRTQSLYRVERQSYERALRFLGLHPYICDRCGRRALMAGRDSPFNWRGFKLVITVRSRFLKSSA